MRIRQSVAALAAIAAGSAAFAAPAGAAPIQLPFTYTGGARTWEVPTGVTEATFTLRGAAGAAGAPGGAGGLGAEVRATLPVTPGETLTIRVGGEGALTGAGGFNGGGAARAGAGAGGDGTTILSNTGASLLLAGG
ncbi:glycine-rich protein, partial [Conexibacter stalactiti]